MAIAEVSGREQKAKNGSEAGGQRLAERLHQAEQLNQPERLDVLDMLDVLVIGAGPTGLACAIDAQRAGFRVALADKGCLCN